MSTMNRDINEAMTSGSRTGHKASEWNRVLQAILTEFRDEHDDFVIAIQPSSHRKTPGFNKKMELELGYLRELGRE